MQWVRTVVSVGLPMSFFDVGTSTESIKIQSNLMGDTVEIPTLTLTKFLRILTWHRGIHFHIFQFKVHILETTHFVSTNTTTFSHRQYTFINLIIRFHTFLTRNEGFSHFFWRKKNSSRHNFSRIKKRPWPHGAPQVCLTYGVRWIYRTCGCVVWYPWLIWTIHGPSLVWCGNILNWGEWIGREVGLYMCNYTSLFYSDRSSRRKNLWWDGDRRQ